MAEGMSWPWPWMVAALLILATVCIALQNKARGLLFKGIASLPVIGYSILFVTCGPRDFLLGCFKRAGDFYNISFMGEKITVVNSPEAIKFVLSTAHVSFASGYFKQFLDLLSEGKFVIPSHHPHYRKAVIAAITGNGLQNLLPFINSLAEKTVKSWEKLPVVNTVDEMQKYVFTVGMHVIWSDVVPGSEEMEQYRKGLTFILGGITVVPINLPGFYFHKALKEKPNPNTFMVFGQGPHMCPGSDLAITETMLLVHHLIITYSWERFGPDQGVSQVQFTKPRGGFPVTVVKRQAVA